MNSRQLTAVIVALMSSPLFAAAPTTRPAATQPTTLPARTYITVSAPLAPDSKETITALVDINDAPEFKEWGVKAANYALKCYPEIDKQLASAGYTAPREFRLVIKPAKGVAYTTGTAITINTAYLKGHTDDFGMVAHELVHVIQQYRGRNPGWLVEGVADYIRYFVIEPGAKNARFNAERSTYKGGYQPAAAMLNWIEKKKGPGVVAALNQAMRERKYTDALFKELAGGDPDDLWTQFKESLKPQN